MTSSMFFYSARNANASQYQKRLQTRQPTDDAEISGDRKTDRGKARETAEARENRRSLLEQEVGLVPRRNDSMAAARAKDIAVDQERVRKREVGRRQVSQRRLPRRSQQVEILLC